MIHVKRLGKNIQPTEDETSYSEGLSIDTSISERVDPKEIHVQVLYRPHEVIHDMTVDSMFTWLDAGTQLLRLEDPFGGWINTTRNWQTRLFLQKSNAKYLFFCDADVGIPWDVPYKLASRGKPVCSGVVPCWNTSKGGLFLNIAVKDPHGTARFPTLAATKNIPKEGLVECHNAGTGCLLVRRDVLERLWDLYEEDEDFGQPFELPVKEMRQAGMTGHVPRGEDVCFTDRIRKAGYSVWADFSAHTVHDKPFTLAWPEKNIKDIPASEWVVSVFDHKVRQV